MRLQSSTYEMSHAIDTGDVLKGDGMEGWKELYAPYLHILSFYVSVVLYFSSVFLSSGLNLPGFNPVRYALTLQIF